jgi:precorrin-6B methylase 1
LKTNAGISVEKFSVFPNPFVSNIKIALNSLSDLTATVRIISFDGKEINRRSVAVQKGDNIIVLNDFASMPKGNYILELTTATDKFIKKIIKN